MSEGQKYPVVKALSAMSTSFVDGNRAMDGKCYPCHVIAVENSIVTVQFDVQPSDVNLPPVTMPVFGPEYIRYPIKIGDKGVTLSADLSIRGISDLGTGMADFTPPPSMTALFFMPIASTLWVKESATAVTVYAPDGVILKPTDKTSMIVVRPKFIESTADQDISSTADNDINLVAKQNVNVTAGADINQTAEAAYILSAKTILEQAIETLVQTANSIAQTAVASITMNATSISSTATADIIHNAATITQAATAGLTTTAASIAQTAVGAITQTAGTITLNAPNIFLNGILHLNGPIVQDAGYSGDTSVTMRGPMTVTNDVTAVGVSVSMHRHSVEGVEGGDSNITSEIPQ